MSDKEQQQRDRIAKAEANGIKQGLRGDDRPTHSGLHETPEEEAALLRGFAAGKAGAAKKP